jgi:hypothetical protein
MARPGCIVRGALVTFGVLFLPMGLWFAWRDIGRYWGEALALLVVGGVFLRIGISRDEDSWIAAIDELGAPDVKKRGDLNE